MERTYQRKGLENALTQCHEVAENFEGSEETLRLIRLVEASLRRLLIEIN